jgi:hypothetical protein
VKPETERALGELEDSLHEFLAVQYCRMVSELGDKDGGAGATIIGALVHELAGLAKAADVPFNLVIEHLKAAHEEAPDGAELETQACCTVTAPGGRA